ncbi:MAG: ABC transporter permease [candidate division KSB1 bacterium]|nr:ABC transporter permease [candidate division KSB1 bacterium]MDZ7275560.1 ABC transporter permease [candidate division KSB1 bacterium]MDZ7286128.1 ABC transporter permease [candidate division KSB1 bacterium]MDZ7296354.1 ABC transporter permease [candidate division KSB1 bacterium]MDZ7347221.1 ABC transporter permease [candidate division KSB1 bacterium]
MQASNASPWRAPRAGASSQNGKPHRAAAGWIWRMAWRDSRTHRRRLLLFVSAITLGIAALVAISSLRDNLAAAMQAQARVLLGADLVIFGRQPFAPEIEALFDSLGGRQARAVRFSSMVYFPKQGGTRLARIKAVAGDFPFYGQLETDPPAAAVSYREGQNALVEEGLLLQYQAAVGDSIKIGNLTFRIAGRLLRIPGESAANAFLGPRVFIPLRFLEATQLVQRGSQIVYSVQFQLDPGVDAGRLVRALQPRLARHRLSSETVASRTQELGRAMQNLTRFLNLAGFMALLLGGIGVASAIHVYIKQKLETIAVLRCLGAAVRQTFGIFLVQTVMMALLGAAGGAALGVYLQTLLPRVLGDFLPVELEMRLSWRAVADGIITGLGLSLLFALLPLPGIRKISPLLSLRSTFEAQPAASRNGLRWLLHAAIALAVTAFAMRQMENAVQGVFFTAAVGVTFGLLAGLAKLLTRTVRRYFPGHWSFVWRQGLANLHRPNNQTLMLLLALGFGTFLLTTLYLTRETLLRQVELTGANQQPDLVLFDVQPDQAAALAALLRSFHLPLLQQVPVVTMRLESINGTPTRVLQRDSTAGIPEWALRREYRCSYRDHLNDNETLLAGKLQRRSSPDDSILVSLEEDIARDLKVKLGDELVFDVQGVLLPTRVGSLRRVNWQRMMPSFFVLFPGGVLENAPQFQVLVTRAGNAELSARVQRAVVQQFPNVSAIDLALILTTVDAILSRAALVIRFMAFFSVLTGLVVLAGAVITSRYQRIQESVLLRTLGAHRRQVIQIMTIEYFLLGGLAAVTGMLLAFAGTWALARFVFEVTFAPALLPSSVIALAVIALTILLGMLNSRGIVDRPPLEVLRAET